MPRLPSALGDVAYGLQVATGLLGAHDQAKPVERGFAIRPSRLGKSCFVDTALTAF